MDRLRRSPAGRFQSLAKDVELMHRAMAFAALGFLTLVPLLIVVAATIPGSPQSFATWLERGLGLSTNSRQYIDQLFQHPGRVLTTTTIFGFVMLAVTGLTFGSALQTGYERVWGLPPARWHSMWRHAVWLAALVAFLVFFTGTPDSWDHVIGSTAAGLVRLAATLLFFWCSQFLLLGGRVRWRALLPGAAITAVALVGLRLFSQLVFSPMVVSNAVSYGPIGAVLVIQSWLVGAGVVVYGGALAGRLVHEARTRRRVENGAALV